MLIREDLYNIVNGAIRRGDAPYNQREIDCLLYLIEDGTISSKEELAEYGFIEETI